MLNKIKYTKNFMIAELEEVQGDFNKAFLILCRLGSQLSELERIAEKMTCGDEKCGRHDDEKY